MVIKIGDTVTASITFKVDRIVEEKNYPRVYSGSVCDENGRYLFRGQAQDKDIVVIQ